MSTELIVQDHSQRPLYRSFVRDGIAGNYDVVYEMIRLIREGVDYDKGLESFIKNYIIEHKLDSYSPTEKIFNCLFEFVVSQVRYIQDIAGRIESLKDARQTLSDGFGDCDDHTVLNATLLGLLGFEEVKIAMARYSAQETSFAHVYCVAYENGKRYAFDTTLPDAKLDKEVKAYETKEVDVFGDVPGLDGFSGIFQNIKSQSRKMLRGAVRAIPSAVNVLPLGFLAGNALATGAQMIDSYDGNSFSLPATASSISAELDKIILDLLQSKIALDHARSQAMQVASQLATVDNIGEQYSLGVSGATIRAKLEFINNFKAYAKANDIRVVHLNPRMMLGAGLVLTAGACYFGYKAYKENGF